MGTWEQIQLNNFFAKKKITVPAWIEAGLD